MIVGPTAASSEGEWRKFGTEADGAPSTVVLAEIADSDIFWTEPRDLSVDELSTRINDRSKPSVFSHYPHGAMVLFTDGSTTFLDDSTTPEQFWAIISNGGHD